MLTLLTVFLVSYAIHGLGITVGYHRLLSHRSFKCHPLVELFFVLAGYLAFEGSPIWWASIHRAHHRYVDTPLDPHSPRHVGNMHAYWGWLTELNYPAHINPAQIAPDLVTNRFYQFLEQKGNLQRMNMMCFACNMLFRVGLWIAFGWQVAALNLLAGVLVLQIPLMLNVICHIPKLGYKNFDTTDDGVNVWWVGLLGLGEGWHNNHHAYPGSARNGMKPLEIDFSYAVIKSLRRVGLVSWLNPGPNMAKQVLVRADIRKQWSRSHTLKRLQRLQTRKRALMHSASEHLKPQPKLVLVGDETK